MTPEQRQRIWAVYESACELPAGDRAAFVEAALAEKDLRARVIELLASADDPFESPPPEPDGPAECAWERLGQSLGRFEILAPLGRGGMGEVYEAFDPELGRRVAIKCIASKRLGAASSVAAFVNEARAASALNHPGVVTVFEVIRTSDAIAIVMELVEGDAFHTLRGAAQPLPRVAVWGQRIAEALAATHAHGIIHRDIKPENLIVRRDGYVKILDFGLAAERSTWETAPAMGTLRYMSPEQGRASELTPATDIFSLGVVLYELATGVHPFAPAGKDDSTLSVARSAAFEDARPPSSIVRSLPAAFDALILEMLAKDPGKRPDAAEVARRLSEPWGTQAPRWISGKKRVRRRIFAGIAVAALAAIGLAGWLWRSGGSNSFRVAQRTPKIVPFTSYEGSETEPTFSPDGRQIAFIWTGEDGLAGNVYVKTIGSEKLLRLTSSPTDEISPVWSPDGLRIAFLRRVPGADEPLVMTVAAAGGEARQIGRIANPEGYPGAVGWWPDSKSLVISDAASGAIALVRLFLDTGEKRPLTAPPKLQSDGLPVLSPDGRRIAFTRREIRGASVCVLDAGTAQSQCLHRVEAAGESTNGTIGGIAWEADGRSLLYADKTAIWRLSLDGKFHNSVTKVLEGSFPFLTGDRQGRRLAFSKTYSDINIWRSTLDGKHLERVAPSSEEESEPQYSPDGSQILFRSHRTGTHEIFVCDKDGENLRQVTRFGGHLGSGSWSPDGKWIAFDGYGSPYDQAAKYTNIYLVSASGGPVRRVTPDLGESHVPAWSRDGRSLYYILADGNRQETWKISPQGGAPRRVAEYGMFDVTESAGGQCLYYTNRSGASGIWRRALAGGEPALIKGTERVQLFRYWALDKDGIFFVEGPADPVVQFIDFGTQRISRLTPIRRGIIRGPRGLTISPDGTSIAYTEEDLTLSDIMLMENIL